MRGVLARNRLAPILALSVALSVTLIPSLMVPTDVYGQAALPPHAPLPSALKSARQLFIGNAGDQENGDCLRAYDQFYADLKGFQRYRLVADPRAADVVLELHYEVDPDAAEYGSGGGNHVRQFRVVIEEPQSRAVLWTLVERTNYANFKSNRDKNLAETVGKLAADVGMLLNRQPVAPDNNSTVKHGAAIFGVHPHE